MRSLYVYVLAVAVVWAFVLAAGRFIGGEPLFKTLTHVCGGFALGMLAMYIAMHLYTWR